MPEKSVALIDFYNNEYLKSVRMAWESGEFPQACSACEQAEKTGNSSRRQHSNQWYQDHGLNNTVVDLIRLDYWTGDICNLACAICGPMQSSAWKQELGWPIELKKSTSNAHWNSIDLINLKFIHFNGGEPLLSKEHVKFLKEIPNKSQVHLNYNTNGTVKPAQELLDLWLKFKLVQLDFSIDDIGERFEYQRYGAKWNNIIENLQWFLQNAPHNCMFAVNISVGILNHDNIENLLSWLKQNFHTSQFADPIIYRQQPVTGIFSLKDTHLRKNKIIDFLNQLDNRRGTNWKTIFPNLVNYLETDK
jgi:MoaA/NifB/PqqE/SkfB family radical SAM enzyme